MDDVRCDDENGGYDDYGGCGSGTVERECLARLVHTKVMRGEYGQEKGMVGTRLVHSEKIQTMAHYKYV